MKKIISDKEFESDRIREDRQTYILFNKRVEEINDTLYYVADGYLPHEVKNNNNSNEQIETPTEFAPIENDEIKELDTILDEAIKECSVEEDKKKVEDLISNSEIYKVALENKKEMIETHKLIGKQTVAIKGQTLAQNKIWKLSAINIVFSLIIGYTIAVYHHDNIKPFIKDIVKELIRKAPIGD